MLIYITWSAMRLDSIRPGDEVPIYRQIVGQVLDALATGRLRPGDRMESHRELAARLVVAPLTVKKAYDELERDGYLETRRGRGTFVRRALDASARTARADRLQEGIARVCREAAAAEVPTDALIARVRAEAERLAEASRARAAPPNAPPRSRRGHAHE
jgi:GntR family transcriptional regulator